MDSIKEIKEKFSESVTRNLDKGNFLKIINFLTEQKCDYIEDIVSDYLDLFNFTYNDFVEKYNKLNQKYDNNFINKASKDMNLLEEFYNK